MTADGPGAAQPTSSVLGRSSPRAYAALFRHRGFRYISLATLLATLGDWTGFLAIIALTADILGPTRAAAFAVSGVMAARVLPTLLLGPVAGVFVDRWDRKHVLIATVIGRGAVMALIPFTNEVLTLLLATLVIEVMSSLFGPAKDAVFPTLIRRDELVLANQVNLIVTYGTLPLAGALYASLVGVANTVASPGTFLALRPIALPIWFNALSFLVSAPLIAAIPLARQARTPRVDPLTAPGPWEEFKEGLRFVGGHPVIRWFIVGVMIAAGAAGVVITTGEFFAARLNAGQSGFGVLVAIVGAGLVAGLIVSGFLTQHITPERLFAPGIGIAGAALAVTAAMPTLHAASIPAFLMGVGAGVVFIVGYTVLQQRADDRIRGRTFGAFNSGVRLAIFGSTILVPTLIGVIGPERRRLVVFEDGTERVMYPYTFGGVRISLLAAASLAVAGAVLVDRALHRALVREREDSLVLPVMPELPGPVAPGLFVVFEGGDGSGKSTQIRLLRAAVERAGFDAVITREPGGTGIGEEVRGLLLSRGSAALTDRAEALLYAAARAQHVAEVIRPALEKGAVVLCDRFIDSSVVYQGAARGLGEPQVAELNRWATGGLVPDLVVLLDVDPAEGLRRAARDEGPDRLEDAGLEFHREVRAAYRRRAEQDPDRYLLLDARRSVEDLHREIRAAVLERLPRRDGDGGPAPSDRDTPRSDDEERS